MCPSTKPGTTSEPPRSSTWAADHPEPASGPIARILPSLTTIVESVPSGSLAPRNNTSASCIFHTPSDRRFLRLSTFRPLTAHRADSLCDCPPRRAGCQHPSSLAASGRSAVSEHRGLIARSGLFDAVAVTSTHRPFLDGFHDRSDAFADRGPESTSIAEPARKAGGPMMRRSVPCSRCSTPSSCVARKSLKP